MMVADVFVDVVSGAFLLRGPLFRNLFHDQDVDQVLPGHRVGPELGPGTAGLGGHGLAQQLIRVVLGRQVDDVAARLAFTLGQHLEDGALADAAAAEHDPLGPGADPLVGL